MPPRHTYWTIIFGNQPTSFRTATREELLPTFRQIQAKHPDAVMMWFARGRLWRSQEEADAARFRGRDRHDGSRGDRPRNDFRGPRPDWRDRPHPPSSERTNRDRGPKPEWNRGPRPQWRDRPPKPPSGGERRGRDWRPGGAHKDPRDRFKVPRDVKRARFKAKARRDRIHPKDPNKKKDEE
jgi:hypothetical protein